MKETVTQKKLSLILLLLVLLPALFYSGYEISSISTSEELIATIYRQQLDVILFSLNQYSLDVANNWTSGITTILRERQPLEAESLRVSLVRFLDKNSSIQTIAISDTAVKEVQFFSQSNKNKIIPPLDTNLIACLKSNKEKIARLRYFQTIDYRKLEPVQITSPQGNSSLALIFIVQDAHDIQSIVTIVLDEIGFIQNTLSPKLQEASREEFVLSVLNTDYQKIIYTTSATVLDKIKQRKPLWLFPHYELGIGMKGATVEELTQSRFYRNLFFIILLDCILIVGVWIVYRNIRKQLEFAQLKSDFVSNVSHELRTPLSLIRMYAETLEMNRVKSDEKRQEYYSTILQESERLTRLVNNILDFSKMEAGKKEYHFQKLDLNILLNDIMEKYQFHLQLDGFSPIIALDSNLPPISADSDAITEAVMNILDNAVKYSADEKYLKVISGKDNRNVFVEIEDHGIGIAPEFHKKIFENFYRVSTGLVHNVKGSGLGLALVKNIIDAHGGKILLESEPGNGSKFRLEFPYNQK